MNSTLMPTKQGQICKITSDIADMELEDVFIVTENAAEFDNDDDILVVNLKELQRNQKNPDVAERISVRKEELVVVAEDLTAYIQSWNLK
ncbi:hypothetical protein [Mucilaginibacter gilvus]|nr:hypothetical protein [Mucilaginibacter gilvus]